MFWRVRAVWRKWPTNIRSYIYFIRQIVRYAVDEFCRTECNNNQHQHQQQQCCDNEESFFLRFYFACFILCNGLVCIIGGNLIRISIDVNAIRFQNFRFGLIHVTSRTSATHSCMCHISYIEFFLNTMDFRRVCRKTMTSTHL